MPKYYEKDDHHYTEKTYESIVSSLLKKADIDLSQMAENAKPPITQQKINNIISTYQQQIQTIEMQAPTKDRVKSEPNMPSQTETHTQYEGGISSMDMQSFMKEVQIEIKHSDNDYKIMVEKFKEEHKDWEDKNVASNEKFAKELAAYSERNDVKETLPELKRIVGVFKNIDQTARDTLKRCIEIPTPEELFKAFKKSFSTNKSTRNELKDLQKEISEINPNLNPDIKLLKFLEILLANYRNVIRTFSTTFIFGDSLAKDLRDFCRKELQIELPKTLEKGQPLAIDKPPINKYAICAYLSDIKNYSVQFTAGENGQDPSKKHDF